MATKKHRFEASLVGETLHFGERVRRWEFASVLRAFRKATKQEIAELVLDFSDCERIHSEVILPLITMVDRHRQQGGTARVVLPASAEPEAQFREKNWAFLLDPERYDEAVGGSLHLPCRRFANFGEQQKYVNEVLAVTTGTMVLSRDVLSGLEWSINEVTDNVLNHSVCETGGIVQARGDPGQGNVSICVADGGRGILASMREGFPNLSTDMSALGEAVKAGVTRNPGAGQGNGLAGTLRISTMSGGVFEIASGNARMVARLSGTNRFAASGHFSGTLVQALLSRARSFSIEDALDFGGMTRGRVDFIELRHDDGAGHLVILMRDEAVGFGSRGAGAYIRTRLLNLLNADRTAVVVIDWAGVPLIASSFADEAFGKLFIELGPLTFSARVKNRNVEGLVAALLDQAIVQRMRQGFPIEVDD